MKQRGFTLVELAIVLAIIAVVLLSVLNSQGLIGSAKAKNIIVMVDDLRAATIYFKQKYNYLPGDWVFTTAGEIPNISSSPGNGNGSLDGAINNTPGDPDRGTAAADSEVAVAPWQLYSAGLLGKLNTSDPKRLITTGYGTVNLVSNANANATATATANVLVDGYYAANPAARNAIVFFNLPCDVVSEVDSKIDDGVTEYVAPPRYNGRAFGTACDTDANIVLWYAVAL